MIEFKDYTIDELAELQKSLRVHLKDRRAEVKENEKAEKAQIRARLTEAGKTAVEEAGKGGTITVNYKTVTLTGEITKIGDKTFTIATEVDGESKNVWRYYYQVAE